MKLGRGASVLTGKKPIHLIGNAGDGVQRLTYLDLARGIAALAVVVIHYRWFFEPALWGNPSAPGLLPLYAILWPFYEYGGTAVQAFWLLSGVVFAATYGRPGLPFRASYFAARRFSRLYPLHIVTLLLVAGIQILSFNLFHQPQVYGNNDAYHFTLQLFLASNWGFQAGDSFNAPIWSVSVEIIAYALFAAYMLIIPRRLAGALAIASVACVYWRISDNLIAYCCFLFFLGVSILLMVGAVSTRLRHPTKIAIAVCCFALGALACEAAILTGQQHRLPAVLSTLCFPLAIGGLVLLDLSLPPVPRVFHWIGEITYATYLTHMPILMLMRMGIDALGWQPLLGSPVVLCAYVGAVIAVSVPVHRYFERPAQLWLNSRLLVHPAAYQLDHSDRRPDAKS